MACNVIISPSNPTCCAGGSVTLTATTNGITPNIFTWHIFKGGSLNWELIPGQTTSTLSLATNASMNGNLIKCVVTGDDSGDPSILCTAQSNSVALNVVDVGSPTLLSVVDNDPCRQTGVIINFSPSGTNATSHDLYVDGVLALSNISSPCPYNPGNNASHSYFVRAVNGSCYADSAPITTTDLGVGIPTNIVVTDNDPCRQTGVTITFTPSGTNAQSYILIVDKGSTKEVQRPGFISGNIYDPSDTATHSYVIRAVNGSCYADSAPVSFADRNDTPGTPTGVYITDNDLCRQTGVTIIFIAGSGAISHTLVVDPGPSEVQVPNFVSGSTYNPGNTALHSYVIRAVNGSCYADSAPAPFADHNDTPGAPAIVSITDNDVCRQTGITINFTGGAGATSHTLVVDSGTSQVLVPNFVSGSTYNPGDTASHSYVIRAMNGSCYTDSSPILFTDHSNTPSAPTGVLVTDIDPCIQSGVRITFSGGAGATSHTLVVDSGSSEVQMPNFVSGGTYNPGNTASHSYVIRAINGSCFSDSTPAVTLADSAIISSAPMNIVITDMDPCIQSGIKITYTSGVGATSHTLVVDSGSSEVQVPNFVSGGTYNPGNTASHSYVIRAVNGSCIKDSTPIAFVDGAIISSSPTNVLVTDIDPCIQSGVSVSFTGGTGATSHTLVIDSGSSEVQVPNFVSGSTYNPGNTGSHSYVIRAINGSCIRDSVPVTFAEHADMPGAPTIVSVADNDPARQTGVTITFTGGSGAISHDLYVDGALVRSGILSPFVYVPGNSGSHTYVVRAMNGSCYKDSNQISTQDLGVGTPTNVVITDKDPCLQSGITITFTPGDNALSHALIIDPGSTRQIMVPNFSSGNEYNPYDTATHTYVIRAINGSSFMDSVPVTFADRTSAVTKPTIDASCVNGQIKLTASTPTSVATYEWRNPSGTVISTSNFVTLGANPTLGNYTLTVKDSSNCTAQSDPFTISQLLVNCCKANPCNNCDPILNPVGVDLSVSNPDIPQIQIAPKGCGPLKVEIDKTISGTFVEVLPQYFANVVMGRCFEVRTTDCFGNVSTIRRKCDLIP